MLTLPVPVRAEKAPQYRRIEAALAEANSALAPLPPATKSRVSVPWLSTLQCPNPRWKRLCGFVRQRLCGGAQSGVLPCRKPSECTSAGDRRRISRESARCALTLGISAADPELFPIEAWRRSVFRASRRSQPFDAVRRFAGRRSGCARR